MTPGISGVVVMISMLMLGALAIVRERERGTWKALLSTPVHAPEAIIGKAIPYLLLGFVQAVGCYNRSGFDGGGNSRVSEAALVIEKAPFVLLKLPTLSAKDRIVSASLSGLRLSW
jgi:ABC-type Na+ efflux pump permease subunit